MSRIWLPPFWVNCVELCWAIIYSYLFKHSVRHFQRHFPSSTISPVFGMHGIQRLLSAPNPLEFIIFRIKTAAFGCAPVYPNGRASHEISNKKQCFQHVRPPTFRTKFHHSSMAMMSSQLSECERYHPVRRWWNHFIIYKNHPSTWCLRFLWVQNIFLAFQYSLPIQDVTRHMWAPQNKRILCNRDLRRKTSRQVLEV